MLRFEFNKPSKILIKKSNAREYIESDIQNVDVSRIDDIIILYVWENIQVSLEEVFEAIQVSNL